MRQGVALVQKVDSGNHLPAASANLGPMMLASSPGAAQAHPGCSTIRVPCDGREPVVSVAATRRFPQEESLQLSRRNPADPLPESPTRMALDQIAALAVAGGSPDENAFNSAMDTIEPRALQALADFFKQLQDNGAQLRLVEGEEDFELDAEAVSRALRRTEQTQIELETVEEDGDLVGLIPHRRGFEWRRQDGETIVGTVKGDIARDYEQSLFAGEPILGPMHARFDVRKVLRHGAPPRLAFTLTQVRPRAK